VIYLIARAFDAMTQCRYSDVSAQHRHDRSTQLLNMQEEASSHVSARRRSDPVPEQFEKRVCMDKLVFVFGYCKHPLRPGCKPASAGVSVLASCLLAELFSIYGRYAKRRGFGQDYVTVVCRLQGSSVGLGSRRERVLNFVVLQEISPKQE